jgi:rhodanese-related sulfurtransferase
MKYLLKMTLGVLLIILLAACAPTPAADGDLGRPVAVDGGLYTDVSPTELQQMLEAKDFVFVNVHIPYEGDIPGTDLSIPFNEIEDNLTQLPRNPDEKIVLYCRSDRMSRIAAETLIGLGYTNVWNLDGGFNAWRSAGLPLEGGE